MLQAEQAKANMNSVIAPLFKDCKAHLRTSIIQVGTGGSENVGAAICKEATSTQAAMIIMTSENKNMVSRFFLGSVADYVVHHSEVPVTVVH